MNIKFKEMKKNTKILITGTLSVLLLVGGTIGISAIVRKAKNKKDEEEDKEPKSQPTSEGSSDFGIKIGDTLYPKGQTVNIRESAKVDDGWYDNMLKEGHTGVIGIVSDIVVGDEDKRTWYKVKLAEPVKSAIPFVGPTLYGYVRSDVVQKG